jgi:hypothetical protein
MHFVCYLYEDYHDARSREHKVSIWCKTCGINARRRYPEEILDMEMRNLKGT